MANLYIIAGCNGAGKTTASTTILPKVLNCREFVNSDSIAAGLSPFEPERYAFEAGRLMLKRIDQLIEQKVDFAFETTLSSKTYTDRIREARNLGYKVYLFFFWLDNVELAIKRVSKRVKAGGHNIPVEVIRRRYRRGLRNFFDLYRVEVDYWMVVNNSQRKPFSLAEGEGVEIKKISENKLWQRILEQYKRSIR